MTCSLPWTAPSVSRLSTLVVGRWGNGLLSADRRIGLLGGGGHCILRQFRSRDHFIDADHEGVLDGSRLRMEKDRLGAVYIGILQVGQRRRGRLGAESLLETLTRPSRQTRRRQP